MSIDKDKVRYIAALARIELDEQEIESYSQQLAKIVDYIEKINTLQLEDIPAHFSPHSQSNVYREDQPSRFENVEGLMKIVPSTHDNFIKIPKVIE